MKKLIAIILAAASVFSLATFSASAENADEDTTVIVRGNVEYIFEAGVSDDHINSFIESCENEHGDEEASTYGITCTILGHNLEASTVISTQHKAYETAPRCIKNIYKVETCTRCDYSKTTLMSTQYVFCC